MRPGEGKIVGDEKTQTTASEGTALRRQLIDHLRVRGYSKSTIKVYVDWVIRLASFYNRSPDLLSEQELLQFVSHLHDKELSCSSINVGVSALIYLYGKVLERPVEDLRKCLPRSRTPVRMPRAYSIEEVNALLEAARRIRLHYTLLSTVYHCGLRLSEVCTLRFSAVQRTSNRLLVVEGKGKKDRYTLLPTRLQQELVDYYYNYRARYGRKVDWMFVRPRRPSESFCPGTLHRIFHRTRKRAGLPHIGGIHILRHSFASHHLMAGMDLMRLKYVLGHGNLKSTMRYFHLVQSSAAYDPSISPLDRSWPDQSAPQD